MKSLWDTSIGFKVLFPSVILILALATVILLAFYGLSVQRTALGAVNEIALARITLIDEFIIVSEQIQSDVFHISLLRFMDMPDDELQPLATRLERGVSDLNVIYGEILTSWPLDDTERNALELMKEPIDAFEHLAQQVVAVPADNPSFGVLLVRSSTVPFAELQRVVAEFRDYEEAEIIRLATAAHQNANRVRALILALTLLIASAAIADAVVVSRRDISTPIRSITGLMGRLADGDLSIAVGDLERKDEIGAMARAVEVFRSNVIEKTRAEEALHESEKRVQMKLDSILSPERDIGELQLADIVDVPEIQSMMDEFFSLTNIGVAVLDLDGDVLVATGWQDICTQFHRVHPETCEHCLESDLVLSQDVEPGTFRIYKCKNHMWDIATPITIGGKQVGNLFLGQFFFADESPDHALFRAQARRYGFDEREYLAALERVPRWSREKVDTVMHFYARFAHMVSSLSYGNIKLARTLAERDDLLNSLRRAKDDLEAQHARVTALYRVGQLLNSTLDPDTILDHLVDEAMRVTRATHGQTLVARLDLGAFERRSLRGFVPQEVELARTVPLPLTKGINGQAYLTGETVCVDDVRAEPEYYPMIPATRSELAVPIIREGQVLGILDLQSPEAGAFRQADLAYLRALTDGAAVALHNAYLLAQTRKQAQRIQGILDTVPEGVLLLDADGQVLLANPLAEQDLDLFAGRDGIPTLESLTHLGDRPLAELLTPPSHGLWHEVQVGLRTFEVIARPLEDSPEATRWVLVFNDVTQERMVRNQLQQHERLAAIGQLAAGIAHDFNNIMAVIVLASKMMQGNLRLSDQDRRYLDMIHDRASHATRLIGQILDFGQRSYMDRAPLDLLPLLQDTLELLERTLPENIHLALAHDREEYIVHGDAARLQQTFMNLATNAHDAMPGGGRLQFALCDLAVEPDRPAPLPDMAAGEWVCLTVSDTGAGIAPEHVSLIFEPFFTTKEPGQGTGLGLPQAYGIVKQHAGSIGVHSQLGEGTTFSLYLPLLIVPTSKTEPTPAAEAAPGGTQTLLLMESEPAVRHVVADLLRGIGYRVLPAASAAETLEIVAEHDQPIDLLLCDLVMPGLSGLDLYHTLRRQRPDLKGLIMTGYALVGAAYEVFEQEELDWIQKPFEIEQLAGKIRALLAGTAPLSSRPRWRRDDLL